MLKAPYGRTDYLRTLSDEQAAISDELLAGLLLIEVYAITATMRAVARTATRLIESHCGIALLEQTVKLSLEHWPLDQTNRLAAPELAPQVVLPVYPATSLDSVTVFEADGTSSAVVINDFFDLYLRGKRPAFALKEGKTWPVTRTTLAGAYIEYTAGYGTQVSDVPEPLQMAIGLLTAFMFERVGGPCSIYEGLRMSGAKELLSPYRTASL